MKRWRTTHYGRPTTDKMQSQDGLREELRGASSREPRGPKAEFKYDAFVSYNQEDPEDKRFVKDEQEGRRGLKLYVPGRDDVSGASEQINNAEQIRRMNLWDLDNSVDHGSFTPRSPQAEFKYDAFVSYNQEDPEDKRFVQELIDELEGRRGLRLYVPGRDDVSGASEQINNAEQIRRRCRRMLIVMSRSYLHSPINDFQEQYAQVVAFHMERLIPIIREEGVVVPRIHRIRDIYDLTNTVNEKTWVRLTTAIRAPIEPDGYSDYNSDVGGYVNQQNIRFPRPSGEQDQTRPKQVLRSQNVERPDPRGSSTQSMSETTQNIRTDLQLLQTKSKKINLTFTNIGKPAVVEDETKSKHVVLQADNSYNKKSAHPEYQDQPTTTILQNPTTLLSDGLNSSHESAQTAEDQTPVITLNQQLTSFSNDQRSEVANIENVQLQEAEDRDGEKSCCKTLTCVLV